jgi:hypothetical protein
MTSCPRITKPTDLHAPGAIDQLIAFHRQTFGGWAMEGEDDEAAKAAEEAAAKEADEKATKDKADAEKAGFPANTRPDDMATDAERAAYYRHQARKHEDRNKDWQRTLGGKTPEQLKAEQDELEELRKKTRSESENAVAEAEKAGEAKATQKYGTKLVAAEFRAVLAHIGDEARRDLIIANLDLTKFINDNGDVDTDKVKSTAAALAPADKGVGDKKDRPDYGGGRRGPGSGSGGTGGSAPGGGIAARREALRAEREAKKKTNSNV